jgi:hypothetical protein
MKEFVNDIQNLIVKHWGKLLLVVLVVGVITNYNDVKRGVVDGWNKGYNGETNTKSK